MTDRSAPHDARTQAILTARDRMLAARGSDDGAAVTALRLICFRVGRDIYGLGLDDVARVVPFQRPTGIPGAPKSVLGLIGVGGRTHNVLDLAALLGAQRGEGSEGAIVVLRHAAPPAGLLCAELLGTFDAVPLPAAEAPARTRNPIAAHVRIVSSGMSENLTVAVLDLRALLAPLALNLGGSRP